MAVWSVPELRELSQLSSEFEAFYVLPASSCHLLHLGAANASVQSAWKIECDSVAPARGASIVPNELITLLCSSARLRVVFQRGASRAEVSCHK